MQLSNISSNLPKTSQPEFALAFTLFTSFMSMGGIVWGTLCVFFELYPQSVIPYGYTILSGFNIWFWKSKEKFQIVRALQMSMSVLLPFLFQMILGGYEASGVVMLWSVLALIACITFHKTDGVLAWLTIFVLLVIVTVKLDVRFISFMPASLNSQSVQQTLLTLNIVIISAMLFFLGRYFIGEQRKALEQIRVKNKALKVSEQEKEVAYQEVLASEEEIRQNAEELRAINEELLDTKSELESALQREGEAKLELEQSKDSEIAKKNEKIMSSLRYAERIQRALLPSADILKNYLPDSFLLLMPRDVVSGDFYWFQEIRTPDKKIKVIVAAADCTGHGVPAAFMSIMGHDALNTIVKINQITEPHYILDEMNSLIITKLYQEDQKTQIKDGMDIAICTLTFCNEAISGEYSCEKIEFAGAKNPLVYIQDKKINFIKGTRKAVGGEQRSKSEFIKHEINVTKDTVLYMFSDGYQDQFGGPRQEKFLSKRFRQLLYSIHKEPMETQQKMLNDVMQGWMQQSNQSQMDDILVMGIKI